MAVDSGTQCTDPGWVSTCSVENTGTQIDVGATTTQPGSGTGQGGSAGESGTLPSAPGSSAPSCVPGPGEMCRGNYTTAFLPEVTMADLASFRPSPPGMVSEPDGVGIAGMPVNLFSDASTHTASGALFGYAVTVRFTPARFRFSYGDGATRTTSTPGASWASRGQAQFSPTDTSHVYADRGDYVASVTAVYTAQVDFGGGWRDVPGTLELVSPGYRVQVLEARTALVRDTCRENAGAPGC